jgi:hypothetical protein
LAVALRLDPTMVADVVYAIGEEVYPHAKTGDGKIFHTRPSSIGSKLALCFPQSMLTRGPR